MLQGNFVGIKKAEAALHKVLAATEQDISTGGTIELSKRAASEEIDCVEYTKLVNRLLKKGAILKNIPNEINCNNTDHHIAVYKFPEMNMIGAKLTSNNPSI